MFVDVEEPETYETQGSGGGVTLPRRGGEEEVEEREEQVGGSEMPKEESGPDGDLAGRSEHVGEQEEGVAGADPAAAGGEDTTRIHPRGSQVGLQQSLLGECPRCETNHNGATSAGESRTRDPAEHGAPPHPRRGHGGGATGDGDDDSETRSSTSPKTKTPLKPSRGQRFKQPEQSQHSDRDPDQRHESARLQCPHGRSNGSDANEHFDTDHGEHDDPVQLGLPPDPYGVDPLLREPAKDEFWSCSNAGAWESQYGSSVGLPMRGCYGAS